MRLGIGIDTGGTYTDAVIFDCDGRRVLASAKSPTTKEDLRVCICKAIDQLPQDLAKSVKIVALSTTLATNACVEGKGARSKLIIMGMPQSTLPSLNVKAAYGMDPESVLCLPTKSSFDGTVLDNPDWQKVLDENADWFSDAQALAVTEMNALRNGGMMERVAVEFLGEALGVPVVAASSVANELNMIERGATALLNARLMPVVESFLEAVRESLEERGIDARPMIVRSDGSFMNAEQANEYAVQTIVSGPAASVQGCNELTNCDNYLVVDMGGTTTDISLVKSDGPVMTRGTRIGDWRTQVEGVFVDTFGLGGDSAVKMAANGITLTSRRVEPLCMAAARWPWLADELEKVLVPELRHVGREVYEVLYLVREPKSLDGYDSIERGLLEELAKGPMVLGLQTYTEIFRLDGTHITKRLEAEGVIMRAGFTPTDAMHIKGDFNGFDARASRIAATYLSEVLTSYQMEEDPVMALCNDVYASVEDRLFSNIVRVIWQHNLPKQLQDEYPESLDALSKGIMGRARCGKVDGLGLGFSTPAALVGVGAPIGIFLPQIAKALNTSYVIPNHAEVANAVGAISTRVKAQVRFEVLPNYSGTDFEGFNVPTEEGVRTFKEKEDAFAFAREVGIAQAMAIAIERGASGNLDTRFEVNDNIGYAFGHPVFLGSECTATAEEL